MGDIEDYLKAVPPNERAALKALRAVIREAAPEATEKISYRIPMFYHCGPLVSYAAFKGHCSFFVQSTNLVKAMWPELKEYATVKGTIHFTADEPLPNTLVKNIVKARIRENEEIIAVRTAAKQKKGK